jgi:hypothetical protein
MNSGGITYEPSLSAHAEGLPAPVETLPASEASAGIPERVDRGNDWPLVFAFFTAVVAAYAAIAYGMYAFVDAAF